MIASDDEVFVVVLMADGNIRVLDEGGEIVGVISVPENDEVLKFRMNGRIMVTRKLLVDAGFPVGGGL